MKKVLELLEKNVQWFAVALGALYMLWMGYTYLLTPPVGVKIGQQSFSPGQVDKYIVNNVVSELTAKMNETRVPSISAPQYVELFKREMGYEGTPAVALATPMFPVGMVEKLEVPMYRPGPRGPTRVAAAPVEKLVEPPPARMLDARVGNSNVSLVPAQRPQPNLARGQANPNPAPVVPVAQIGVDKSWATLTYSIPMNELANAFRATKLPPELYHTSFLQVELVRQEKLPDGNWGPETLIKPLAIHKPLPLPPAKSPGKLFQAFLDWANANTKMILQPDFYTVLKGDAWGLPGQAIVQTDEAPPKVEDKPFNPADFADATLEELMKLTPEQRQQVAKWKDDKKKQEQKNKGKSGGSTGGRKGMGGGGAGGGGLGGGAGGRGGYGPSDGGRPGGRDGSQEGNYDRPSDLPQDGQRGEQQPPNSNIAQPAYPLPNGDFDPRLPPAPEIVGWAHDDSIHPGRIYRYRVVYRIKSPVFGVPNATKPASLADTFDLASKPSEWSREIEVPSLTSFYVVSAQQSKSTASVEVFRSQGGVLQGKKFEVSPGDVIGTIEGEVDFTTGWTMVDSRTDLRTGDQYVIIMDPDGRLHRRDVNSDRNSPEYQKAKAQVASGGSSDGRVAAGSGDSGTH